MLEKRLKNSLKINEIKKNIFFNYTAFKKLKAIWRQFVFGAIFNSFAKIKL